jgi:hypothetical protein
MNRPLAVPDVALVGLHVTIRARPAHGAQTDPIV